jgi:hypothetical protein
LECNNLQISIADEESDAVDDDDDEEDDEYVNLFDDKLFSI